MSVYNDDITYVKSLGIILMVLGHCECSVPYATQILYMFHMPLFFFFSGYCFKKYYYNQPRVFIWRRVKGLYWPYIKWSLVFLLLHNVFFYLNLYNETYGKQMGSDHLYGIQESLYKAFTIVTHMNGHEQLLGGYWFLRALFFGAILAFLLLYAINYVTNNWKVKSIILEVFALVLVIMSSVIINHYKIIIPYFHCGSHATHAATFFLIGFLFRKYDLIKFNAYTTIIAFSLVVFGSFYWRCDMNELYYNNPKMICFIVTAVLGTWGVYSLPWYKMNSIMARLLKYIGDNTLTILTWHFLCFKLASLILIMVYGLPINQLAMYPVISDLSAKGWWALYFILGVSIPLTIPNWYRLIKSRVHI